MDKVLVRNALQGMIRATDDDSTPIIRRLARVQARAALANLDAEAASGAGEREDDIPQYAPDDIPHLEGLASYLDSYARGKGRAGLPASKTLFEEIAKRLRQFDALRLASLPPATDPAIPDGWKLVPIEPTDEMLEAAAKAASRNDMPSRVDDVVPYEECDSLFRAEWRAEVEAAYLAALAAAPIIPATGEAEPKPLRVDWNKHDLAEAYDLVEGVRSKMTQSSESPLDTSLRAALNAIEAADCEWDGLTKAAIPATGHAATEGEGA